MGNKRCSVCVHVCLCKAVTKKIAEHVRHGSRGDESWEKIAITHI